MADSLLGIMDAILFITVFALMVVSTAARHRASSGRIKARRELWLLKEATRAAKSSQMASSASVRLSNASRGLSSASARFSQAAELAQQSDRSFEWVCLHLYSKWLLFCSGWFIGRATQLGKRADTKLHRCTTILDSLGVKHDASFECPSGRS